QPLASLLPTEHPPGPGSRESPDRFDPGERGRRIAAGTGARRRRLSSRARSPRWPLARLPRGGASPIGLAAPTGAPSAPGSPLPADTGGDPQPVPTHWRSGASAPCANTLSRLSLGRAAHGGSTARAVRGLPSAPAAGLPPQSPPETPAGR